MIRLNNVNKYFNKKKSNEIHVINNTSIELEDKGLVAFLGNSGCGKTTLLNAIGGLDKVSSGEIYIDNKRITKIRDGKKDEIRNEYIGYIFQNYNLIEDRTVFFNVEIVLRMMGLKDKEEIKKRVLFILEKVGIERYKNRPVKALSGGERQRVGIARALVKNPKIIIADEPTGNLDSRNTIEIMNIIKAVSKEKLVILVTHERELAYFYASRIVEIIDGSIVSDRENKAENELDYHMENKIFLKDMTVQQDIKSDNVNISYYSDNPDKQIDIKVVVKNNNIYIELPEGYREGSETTELVNGHYEKLSKDIYEDYSFDYKDINGKNGKIKYTSVFSFWKILLNGYKKIFSYSLIKKILLVGFILSAAMTIYSVSNIAATFDINDEDFLTTSKNYLTVETENLSTEEYEKFSNMEGIDYAIPGNGKFIVSMPIDDFYQSAGQYSDTEAALADKDMLKKEDITVGKLPSADNEVVIDEMIIKNFLNDGIVKQIGIHENKDFVGRQIKSGASEYLIISGISHTGNPCVFMNRNNFFDAMTITSNDESYDNTMEISNYKNELEAGNIELKTGSYPDGEYEVMMPYSSYGTYYIGSTSSVEINGHKLIVTGFYDDKIPGREMNLVGEKTMRYSIIESKDNIVLSPSDKEQTLEKLQSEHFKVVDNYATERKEYINALREQTISKTIVSLIILIISIIEIYLMLRASFLSRIKEIGVLRAIGLKKKDVYKMFLGEIIAMTTITAVPSLVIMAYILNSLESVPFVGEYIVMNPLVFCISLGIIIVVNTVSGLLPVFGTMRKTPAAILARNDVN